MVTGDDGQLLDPVRRQQMAAAFAQGAGHGLLHLGATEVGTSVGPVLSYFRSFSARYVAGLCAQAEAEINGIPNVVCPSDEELEALVHAAPPMVGGEYLSLLVLQKLWAELQAAFANELKLANVSIAQYLSQRNSAWNLVGRVHFNLAESRKGDSDPFAFLATFTPRLSSQGRAQHVPLGQALRDYAGAKNKNQLLTLLLPVQRAAQDCVWLKALVDDGDIYHPLRWSAAEAFAFLKDVPLLERAGVVVRMPATWRAKRPSRPTVNVSVGAAAPSKLGGAALVDFQMEVTLEGERLSKSEINSLLKQSEGLVLIRGRWVQIDSERLQNALDRFSQLEASVSGKGLKFAEAMRMLAGANVTGSGGAQADPDWATVSAGPWLAEALKGLRSPEGLAVIDPGSSLKANLRPYQLVGLRWLHLLASLGLGACLADDMGLGKTMQVLSLLLVRKQKPKPVKETLPSMLAVPASLLGNWTSEIERFAPSLTVLVAHPSAMTAADCKALPPERLKGIDLVITTYGSVTRIPWLQATTWDLVIIDEAQVIKNPGAQQTLAVKKLNARSRVALTGTPVENRIGDLWSIFDFTNPGLLGSAKEFSTYAKRISTQPENAYGPLRDLVRPYILRRLKTDKSIISDLPEKTELNAYCNLSPQQAALYQQAVDEFAKLLKSAEGIKRKGMVLSFLMRFKQICNHPSQWLGDGAWEEEGSGKFGKLREIAEVVAEKQEKMLVFSQFREVSAPLCVFLESIFGRPGLALHGDTEIKQRKELVRQFQEDEASPFFVLSLKAGGSGLNLTAAAHVVHFDRWWNPAVENQATDRAFRIGQRKNVLVHKFVCKGTVEEKIAELIESKRQLSQDLLEGGAEFSLTEMKDADLLRLVTLDLKAAMGDG